MAHRRAAAWVLAASAGLAVTSSAMAQQYVWTGALSNGWAHAENWTPKGPPPNGSSVTIGSGFDQIWCGSTQTYAIVDSRSPLLVTSPSWTITGQGVFDGLILSVGAFHAQGEILFTGSNAWEEGVVQGAGGLKVTPGSTLLLTAATSSAGARTLSGTTLTNDAQVSQDRNLIVNQGGRVINNGTWNADNANVSAGANGATFEHRGSLYATGNVTISTPIECHNGTFNSESTLGALTLNAGGQLHGATFTVENGSTIWFLSPTAGFQADGGIVFGGQGTIRLGGSGVFHVASGGSLTAQVAAPKGSSGGFVLSSGELLADGPVTNNGRMEWTGGTIRSTDPSGPGLTNNDELRIFGGSLRARLVNTSEVSQVDTLTVREGGEIETTPGSQWTMLSCDIAGVGGAAPVFKHSGLLAAGGENAKISVGMELRGGSRVVAAIGSLTLMPSAVPHRVVGNAVFDVFGTDETSSEFRVANNAVLEIKPSGSLELTGDGLHTLGSAQVSLEEGAELVCNPGFMSVQLQGTQINGPGALRNQGRLVWTAGTIAVGSFLNEDQIILPPWNPRTLGNDLRNTGRVDHEGTVQLIEGVVVINEGEWVMRPGASLSGTGRMLVADSGTLARTGSGGNATVSARLDNQGTVHAQQGTLTISGPVEQLDGTTLTGGRWAISPGAALSTNGRTITRLAGATVVNGGTWTNLQLQENAGEIEVQGEIQLQGFPFENLGPLRLVPIPGENPPQINAPGGIDNGILGEIDEQLVISSPGPRGGGGIITPLLHNSAGVILPGRRGQAGPLRLTGDFLQTGGTLEIDLAGNVPFMMHDQLAVDGDVTLGGTLKVTLLGGFTPTPGQSFHIINATGAVAGQFDTLDLPSPGPGLSWRVDTGTGGVTLTAESACTADFNGDGSLSVADFTAFRHAYLAGDLRADLSGDSVLNVADFTAFRNAYLAGCP